MQRIKDLLLFKSKVPENISEDLRESDRFYRKLQS